MVPCPDQHAISRHYAEHFKSFALSWSPYFHFGIFDQHSDYGRAKERTLDLMAGHARLTPTTRTLDLGCGIGSSVLYFAQQIGCPLIGIDPVPAQIVSARRRAAALALPCQIRFTISRAEAITEPAQSLDAVVSNETLCHVADKPRALRDIRRILRPTGRFVFTDLYDRLGSPVTDLFHATMQHVTPMVTRDEYEGLLRQAGFTVAAIYDYSHELARNYMETLARMEQLRDPLIAQCGADDFYRAQAFYRYCLTEPIQRALGWALFVCHY